MSNATGPVETRTQETDDTTELVREALEETRDLVRLEVALAREELRDEILRARESAIAFGGAGALGVAAFTMLMVAVALALPMPWLAAVIMGGALLVVSGALAFAGWSALPRKPLGETRERLQADLKQLRERVV